MESTPFAHGMHRRDFLARAISSAGVIAVPVGLAGCGGGGSDVPSDPTPTAPVMKSNIANLGPLEPADANGLRLPKGFTARVVARAGGGIDGSTYVWHSAPDGGCTIAAADGGWYYVSNSEVGGGSGGVGVLRFDATGSLVSQYAVLSGTSVNCSGGRTPWGTWLSCEEFPQGRVWECDPTAPGNGVVRPALGILRHEAVAVDPVRRQLFMTEDIADGRFYRFVPSDADWPAGAPRAALQEGRLQVLVADSALPAVGTIAAPIHVTWKDVIDATVPQSTVRDPEASVFSGGEGCFYYDGMVYFTTQGDNRVWKYDAVAQTVVVVYDARVGPGELTGVDNLTISSAGDVVLVEAPGNLEIRVLGTGGATVPIVQVVGQVGTTLSGPAFSPDGRHFYFSSYAAPGLNGRTGATYEVTGPFFVEA